MSALIDREAREKRLAAAECWPGDAELVARALSDYRAFIDASAADNWWRDLEEAQMEYADCWHEGDRLRGRIAVIGQELREWQDYADQPKAREIGVKGTRWADGYRQGWIAARTMLRTKPALLALLSAGDKAEAPLDE